ncbi:hypothetical protein, partial [Pseudomonas syringae group genomosp. 7]|uniref:hypothetical protein n=1 Tax=Pseudomonas syringae group genomosp. 7 TaxID=251699 RepID=UPI00376F8E0F
CFGVCCFFGCGGWGGLWGWCFVGWFGFFWGLGFVFFVWFVFFFVVLLVGVLFLFGLGWWGLGVGAPGGPRAGHVGGRWAAGC